MSKAKLLTNHVPSWWVTVREPGRPTYTYNVAAATARAAMAKAGPLGAVTSVRLANEPVCWGGGYACRCPAPDVRGRRPDPRRVYLGSAIEGRLGQAPGE